MSALRYLSDSPGTVFVLNAVVAVTLILDVTGLLVVLARRHATNVYAICLGGLVTALLIPVAASLCDWLSIRIAVFSLDSLVDAKWQGSAATESNRSAKYESFDGVGRSLRVTPNKPSPGSKNANLSNSNAASELTGPEFISAASNSDADRAARRRTTEHLYQTLAIFVAVVWTAGVLLKLAKAAHGVRVIKQTLKQGRLLPLDAFPGLTQQVELAIDSPRMPAVFECSNVQVPMAVGILRPTVLLPKNLATRLSQPELRDVLVHECGHLLRKDNLTAWFQIFTEAIFWFHPLVYFVSRRLSRACEELCDNLVIRNGSRDRFAQLLLTLATQHSHHPATALTIVDHRWRLEHRVAALLDKRRSTATQVGWTRGLVVMSAFAVLVMLAAASRVESNEPTLLANASQGDIAQPSDQTPARDTANDDGQPVDSYGDPLSAGAVARLGSVRLHHDSQVTAVALSPGNKTVFASASYYGDVRLWDLNTGKQIHLLQRDSIGVRALRFSPDG